MGRQPIESEEYSLKKIFFLKIGVILEVFFDYTLDISRIYGIITNVVMSMGIIAPKIKGVKMTEQNGFLDITRLLRTDGEKLDFDQSISLDAYDPRFSDVVFRGTLKNIVGVVTVKATVSGTFTAECDRCLDPATLSLSAKIDTIIEAGGAKDDSVYVQDGVIDLTRTAYDALSLEIPMTVLCRPDCKGLCAGCGANLNVENCRCAKNE